MTNKGIERKAAGKKYSLFGANFARDSEVAYATVELP